jgi:hypothetical protein
MMPSQPPDMTNATRASASSGVRRVRWAMTSRKQRCASGLEKSLTRPLPSVLAITPTMSSARTLPSARRASRPDMSSGPAIGNLNAEQSQLIGAPCAI